MRSKVGIIGAGGLIGTALQKFMASKYEVQVFKSKILYSDAEHLATKLESLDIIINLAGHPVAGRWNKKIKKLIYNSRIDTTKNLVNAINMMKIKPFHFINASAVGIYADGKLCDENSTHFAGNFLSKVVRDWEREAESVSGVKLTIIRIGVVLSRTGGAYTFLRKIFKVGVGGRIGSGKQGFSFILIDDLIRIFDFVICNKIYGIINAVSPNPSTNQFLTLELAKILKRPALIPIPVILIKLLYGEGSCTILDGQKVVPFRLLEYRFVFVGNNLSTCLKILEK